MDQQHDRSNQEDQRVEETNPSKTKTSGLDQEKVALALGSSHHHPLQATLKPQEGPFDLGLDISSSITGAVLITPQGGLMKMGHVPLTSSKLVTLFDKADAYLEWVKTFVGNQKVGRIFVEANAKGYSAGFSSADTLFTLAKMNAIVSYLSHKHFQAPVIDVNVTSARSRIGYKNVKADKRPVKEKVRDFVLSNHPELPFETREVEKGAKKGQRVPVTGAADEIDAFVIAKGGQYLNPVK